MEQYSRTRRVEMCPPIRSLFVVRSQSHTIHGGRHGRSSSSHQHIFYTTQHCKILRASNRMLRSSLLSRSTTNAHQPRSDLPTHHQPLARVNAAAASCRRRDEVTPSLLLYTRRSLPRGTRTTAPSAFFKIPNRSASLFCLIPALCLRQSHPGLLLHHVSAAERS